MELKLVHVLSLVVALSVLGSNGQQPFFRVSESSGPNRFFRVSTTSNEILQQPEKFIERLSRDFGIPAQQIGAAVNAIRGRPEFQGSQQQFRPVNRDDTVVVVVTEEQGQPPRAVFRPQRPQQGRQLNQQQFQQPQQQFQQPQQQFQQPQQQFQQPQQQFQQPQQQFQQPQQQFQQPQQQFQQAQQQFQQPQQQFQQPQQQFQQPQQQFQQPQQPIQQPVQQLQVPQQLPVQEQVQQQPPRQQVVQQPSASQEAMTEVCLACICQAATSCNLTTQCVSNGQYCGPFLISRPYWVDAERPTLLGDNPSRNGAFEDCAADPVCSAQTVRSYMGKYSKDCNNDGKIDCDDLGRIHLLGYYGCGDPSIVGKPFYQKFNQCYLKASRLSL